MKCCRPLNTSFNEHYFQIPRRHHIFSEISRNRQLFNTLPPRGITPEENMEKGSMASEQRLMFLASSKSESKRNETGNEIWLETKRAPRERKTSEGKGQHLPSIELSQFL